jgi:REP element-mobilizing transposase RayT
VTIRSRGHLPLPHWETNGGTYFVTFRLAGSVPAELVRDLERRKRLPNKLPGDTRPSVKEVEAYLDRCDGTCHLNDPAVSQCVADAIQFLDGKGYRLIAWVVMPNHVHLIFKLLPGASLSRTLHALKSFTAKAANKLLKRTGQFWQREYYDRLIRNDAELQQAVEYVRNNPVFAGLQDWKWVGQLDVGETPTSQPARRRRYDSNNM